MRNVGKALMSLLLLIATLICASSVYAYNPDTDGIPDNATISSHAHRHAPAAAGHRHSLRHAQRVQNSSGSGGPFDARTVRLACAVVESRFVKQTLIHSGESNSARRPDSKRWLTLRTLLI
jgi:hypothetical protein